MNNSNLFTKKYLTTEGRQKAEEELYYLKTEKRPLIAEKIETAKELGDLSENAEYAEAKDEQAFVEARILELTNLIKYAEVVPHQTKVSDIVNVGSTVTIEDETGQRTYIIVGFNEANPSAGKISNESPLGQALLGRRVGEIVSFQIPSGFKKLTIIAIK
ncbi:transcription elongation factor GreA [Candidatus Uhrbacteria bacterium RIFCSPLOWO2_12_FULL_46_10]|uniref:Transcription elongation factor GreA n=1 Tax=Candidatus Uhrbacteria bacterium RIFCSPLOWO2_01_FULL_47_25 TaxID=1802402 RepID=A0A1F7UXK1_9BACT|nr:MAG: transcription elongation factor GreA [Parcubacteria group bacterium GW2011_GWA2_46_9]OGL60692.1 MAG: transcription elongation factor GreA [Candidatus Uhrbacteria bacterium RIFCSPHIGHO2_01_FULL_46_23]OGL70323.1 MAG: transcription elongation factor GreA [Candidatus Uhrbacteria bacterium RIFCSPHIGHO2_02_FULL_47_29]OGL83010.1 MAG: transcription elongation factor GreA [Candidatus Uhrbacteria bacterium RIFCSPLOWO2_01_FULL_47_25]OGL84456.1 MAG: transcription elongation factor GreA [Candidatus 